MMGFIRIDRHFVELRYDGDTVIMCGPIHGHLHGVTDSLISSSEPAESVTNSVQFS